MKKNNHQHHYPHCSCSPHCSCPPHCGESPHCGYRGYDSKEGFVDLFWEFYLSVGLFFTGFKKSFFQKKEIKTSKKTKVAFIGNYSAACGISTYNENLLKELREFVDLRLFAEYLKEGEYSEDPDWIVRCWSRKEHPKLDLIKNIIAWNPDIVHISHEYGIFPYAFQFTSLVSNLRARGIKVVTTFHSIYEHIDKTVTENSSDYIVVHTDEAAEVLVKKGIARNKIKVIPHGSSSNEEERLVDSLWNTWNSEHTIFQPGFLFSYKGHERVLRAVAKLKDKYPDIHYIIQGSENQFTQKEHDELYKKLISEADRLGISHNITINRGFVSIDVLMSYIRTVKCCVLPYQTHKEHDVRATSGIARLVLSTTTPLVVSDVHLFDDLKGIVPIVKNDNELAEAIDSIFSGTDEVNKHLEKRIEFIKSTSWQNVAKYTKEYYDTIL